MKKIASLLLTILLTACLFTGCGDNAAPGSAASGGTAGKIAYMTNASINDGGWNQACYGGMVEAAKQYNFETAYTENIDKADYVTTLSDYANMGFDLIFVPGNEYTDAILEVAPNYPDVGFMVLNGDICGDNYISIKADNVQMGFMAGVVAGLRTKTKHLGYVGAEEITTSIDCLNGYEQGAQYIDPAIDVASGYTGSWTDSAKGKEIAISMISAKDVDVFFGNAGQVDVGVREGAAEHTDRYGIAQPSDCLQENPDLILTSIVTDNVALISLGLEDWVNGSFGGKVYSAGAAEKVLSYGAFGNNAKEFEAQAMDIYNKLAAGEITLTR